MPTSAIIHSAASTRLALMIAIVVTYYVGFAAALIAWTWMTMAVETMVVEEAEAGVAFRLALTMAAPLATSPVILFKMQITHARATLLQEPVVLLRKPSRAY
jgi:hypothetical protein